MDASTVYDVNGDQAFTTIDALVVVNAANMRVAANDFPDADIDGNQIIDWHDADIVLASLNQFHSNTGSVSDAFASPSEPLAASGDSSPSSPSAPTGTSSPSGPSGPTTAASLSGPSGPSSLSGPSGPSSPSGPSGPSGSNSIPEPSNDWAYTIHDQDATGNVAWNDGLMQNPTAWQDYDLDTVTFVLVDNVSNGTLTLDSSTGDFTYEPDTGFVGSDTFTYELSDGLGTSTYTATVHIDVTNSIPEPSDDWEYTLHDQDATGNVAGNDGLTQNGTTWQDYDGDTVAFVLVDNVASGTLTLDSTTGEFLYEPDEHYVGTVTFTYELSDGLGASVSTAVVTISVVNSAPQAMDDTFEYPNPGDEYVDIDVLENDYDSEDSLEDLTIQSVTSPSDGGTAEIVFDSTANRYKIRYRPPADYDISDPTLDVCSVGTELTYTVADPVGALAQADVKAAPKRWDAWREYSRGNDDPNEPIYETGKIKVELIGDTTQKKVNLKYSGTSTTNSMLRWFDDPNDGVPWPILQNVTNNPNAPGATPEYQIYQPYLFLQPGAGAVPATPTGASLGYSNGALSAEIEVASWTDAPTTLSGTAFVQMQVNEIFINGQWVPVFTDPAWWAANPPPQNIPTRLAYSVVRQTIPWSVTFQTVDGALHEKETKLDVTENTLGVNGTQGQSVTPLRIIDSSNGEGDVYKVGYPVHPGVVRKDADPNAPGTQDDPNTPGDQREEPATAIPDWNTKVKAKTK